MSHALRTALAARNLHSVSARASLAAIPALLPSPLAPLARSLSLLASAPLSRSLPPISALPTSFPSPTTTSALLSPSFFPSRTLPTPLAPPTSLLQRRHAASPFVPRRRNHRKAQKGRLPHSLGGSTRGSEVAWGTYGLRVLRSVRMTARQLDATRNIIRRLLKPVKGARIYMRVFPDLPVTSKGAETRMGKGKGNVEFWACRVRAGKVIFEIAGPSTVKSASGAAAGAGADDAAAAGGGMELSEDLAREALTAAMVALPVPAEVVLPSRPALPSASVSSTSVTSSSASSSSSVSSSTSSSPSSSPTPSSPSSSTSTPTPFPPRLPSFVRKYRLPVPASVRAKLGVPDTVSDRDLWESRAGAVVPRMVRHVGQL
ncbi:ribosomal protein L16 [Gonapodya prolifera JEL478]|uniref:Ribosomal protein L16 n=1 Tax=Gonapodya prolifera (strain JEL478) TaxID=1344416 RepID=A0A139ARF2_GONPJ|nr:ribosomal protein L16 [Gonapodya prolifera JEL478]|eukprot:KXS19330.1 ribosomal protein L16 [Gonapodya prolifera JEL478]